MQSDCSLHSSSLPDQPRDIKLSKRPLDSIVTNEGPSKCSYVASSSKQPSESRVFPAVDSFVQRLANDSIRSKQIDNLSSSDKWISILGEEFDNVATVLESYLSCPDDLQQIQSTLRYTVSYPSTFVHILLLPMLPELTPEDFDPRITNDTYCAFCRFVQHAVQPFNSQSNDHSSPSPTTKPHPAYPLLQQNLANIVTEKTQHKRVAKGFVQSEVLKNLHIHRLKSTNPANHTHETLGKKIVLDCPDFDKFPKSEYYHVDSKRCHIVGPSEDDLSPQTHLLVMHDIAPPDTTIRELWFQHGKNGEDFAGEDWFAGVAFYNWSHKDKRLSNWLKRSATRTKRNVDARKNIRRSDQRQGEGISAGVLYRPDQRGNVDIYSNFQPSIQEDQKYLLNHDADGIADCIIRVNLQRFSR
jgi:hypothetical protein